MEKGGTADSALLPIEQAARAIDAFLKARAEGGVVPSHFDMLGNCCTNDVRNRTLFDARDGLEGLGLFGREADGHGFAVLHALI